MKEYLQTLFGVYSEREGLFIELRAFRPGWMGGKDNKRLFCPLSLNGEAQAIQTLESWNGLTYESYIGVLPRTGKDGTQGGVTHAGFLWADIDAGEGDSESALTLLKAAIKRLNIPIPDMVVKSGGGYHAYWGLSEAVTLSNHHEREVFKALLRRLSKGIGGTEPLAHADIKCAEVARVLRPAGTFNNKIPAKPRPVELVHLDLRYALTFADWQALLPAPPPPPRRESPPITPADLRGYAGLVNWSRDPIPEGIRHGTLVAAAKWLLNDVGVPVAIAYDLLHRKASVSYGSHPVTEKELKEIVEWATR